MGEVDPKLMEMADVFHIPFKERLKYIILPAKFGRSAFKASEERRDADSTGASKQS